MLPGAKMPAILVETSFLSHAEEESRLASDKYQADVAQAIAHGVEDFLGRRQLAKVQVDWRRALRRARGRARHGYFPRIHLGVPRILRGV
jgi:hypothetical protein